VLKFGYPAEPPTLDPLAAGGASAATRDILRPILPALFKLDADLRPQPDLAARWPSETDIDFDPFSVAVTLREAKWSDGRPISAEDVRFSLERLRSGPTGYRYRYLRAVDVLDARSFRLRFDRVVRRWWSLFSLDDMILPAHAYSEQWARGPTVSGGPFSFGGWTDGLQITLRRNQTYWGAKPFLRGVDVVFVPDEETRFQLMQLDDIDAFFAPGEVNIGRRAKARGLELTNGALRGRGEAADRWSGAWWELDIDAEKIGTNVARAVIEAVDPILTDEIFEDSGRPMNSIPSSFVNEPENPSQPWAERGDLAEARSLLGSGGTRSFQLAFPRVSGAGAIARFIHFRLRELGITAELVSLEPQSFEKTWLPERRAAAVVRLRRAADAVDASAYASVAAQVGAAPIDEAVAAAESTATAEAIEGGPVTGLDDASWLRAQQGLFGAATVAPLVRARTWIVGDDGVIGPVPGDALSGPFWNAATWRLETAN
jgi:ABC-type transport system substrate-binding protein